MEALPVIHRFFVSVLHLLHGTIIFQFFDLDSEFSSIDPDIEVHHDVQLFMYEPLPVTAAGMA